MTEPTSTPGREMIALSYDRHNVTANPFYRDPRNNLLFMPSPAERVDALLNGKELRALVLKLNGQQLEAVCSVPADVIQKLEPVNIPQQLLNSSNLYPAEVEYDMIPNLCRRPEARQQSATPSANRR